MKSRFAAKGIRSPNRRAEQGQTILLVAVSIVALLAMAALAIDVVTLYVAKSQIQVAADALALAGATAIANSGVTTLAAGDTDLPTVEGSAQTAANAAINAALAANLVDGQTPALVGSPTIDFATHGNNNPTVTVTLQQTNLPTFFARIFARTSAMTQATATAEAYNPANMQEFTPVTPVCVKPWLMGDFDPTSGNQLINPATGQLEPNVDQLIGNSANSFYLTSYCDQAGGPNKCNPRPGSFYGQAGNPANGYLAAYYAPATVDFTNIIQTSCSAAGSFDQYALDVAGCDLTSYTWTQCGGTQNNLLWNPGENPNNGTLSSDQNSDTALGAECLLGLTPPDQTGPGLGQDSLSYQPSPWPAGSPAITINRGAENGTNVSTSNSIVTIPVIAPQLMDQQHRAVTVIGFVQAFINQVGYLGTPKDYGDINITVMNVVGCSQTPTGNSPVTGGNGASTIPVRLITPP
jgi:hypothetical protein